MTSIAPLVLATLIPLGILQAGDVCRTYSVTQVCGKVVRVHTPVVKTGSFNETRYVTKNLKGIRVKLYRRGIDGPCCVGLKPLAEATTSNWGNFNFKGVAAGSYWLVAQIDGHEYQMPIQYEPTNDGPLPLCSHCWYQIEDSGAFTFASSVTVTVD